MIVPTQYIEVHPYSEHKAAVKSDKIWGYIDERNVTLIKPTFNDAGNFSEDLAPVKIDSAWGFIDDRGNIIIKPTFVKAFPFKNALADVEVNTPTGLRTALVDKNGIVTFVDPLQTRINFIEGMAMFERHNNWGFVNEKGRTAIEPIYDAVEPFSDGLALCPLRHEKRICR